MANFACNIFSASAGSLKLTFSGHKYKQALKDFKKKQSKYFSLMLTFIYNLWDKQKQKQKNKSRGKWSFGLVTFTSQRVAL